MQEWHQRFTRQAGWTKGLRAHLLERANVHTGTRILDVGCGTGVINKELEGWNIPQFGLDININQLKLAAKNTLSTHFTQGDAHWLPFVAGRFDLVMCHFLLMWVQDPHKALLEMARVTRSGGSVIAFAEPDYGGRIDYPPKLEILGAWQTKSLQQQGANPLIGRQLAGLFNRVGLESVETGVLGGQWSGPPDWDSINSEWRIIESDMANVPGLFSDAGLQELKELDHIAYHNGERLLYVPTFYAWGIVA